MAKWPNKETQLVFERHDDYFFDLAHYCMSIEDLMERMEIVVKERHPRIASKVDFSVLATEYEDFIPKEEW